MKNNVYIYVKENGKVLAVPARSLDQAKRRFANSMISFDETRVSKLTTRSFMKSTQPVYINAGGILDAANLSNLISIPTLIFSFPDDRTLMTPIHITNIEHRTDVSYSFNEYSTMITPVKKHLVIHGTDADFNVNYFLKKLMTFLKGRLMYNPM